MLTSEIKRLDMDCTLVHTDTNVGGPRRLRIKCRGNRCVLEVSPDATKLFGPVTIIDFHTYIKEVLTDKEQGFTIIPAGHTFREVDFGATLFRHQDYVRLTLTGSDHAICIYRDNLEAIYNLLTTTGR